MSRYRSSMWTSLVGLTLLPSVALAQAISGAVTDSSGAVMPGVTVEASSAALIEKSRTVVTDDAGRYQILNLRPGIYVVTFTCKGFVPVKRENIQLSADFTAPVSVQLDPGGGTEVVTVEATAPMVDVVNLANPQTITAEMLEALPLGSRTLADIMGRIPGVAPGFLGSLTYRGSADTLLTVDGNRSTFLNAFVGPGGTTLGLNAAAYQEYSVSTAIDAVDSGQAGMRINVVPKDGGNRFSSTVFIIATGNKWRSDNRGIYKDPPYNFSLGGGFNKAVDFEPTAGGPIIKDRLWFQATAKYRVEHVNVINFFADANPDYWVYRADPTKPLLNHQKWVQGGIRLTGQVSPRDKIAGFYDDEWRYFPEFFAFGGADITGVAPHREPHTRNMGIKWTRVQSSQLVLEVNAGSLYVQLQDEYRGSARSWNVPAGAAATSFQNLPVPRADELSINSAGIVMNQPGNSNLGKSSTYTAKAEATYIRGPHTMRMGGSYFGGIDLSQFRSIGDVTLSVTAVTDPSTGVTTARATSINASLPTNLTTHINADIGLWFQEQWTHKRLTTKVGMRYDGLRTGFPEQVQPASVWLPELRYPGRDVLRWHDITPRISGAFDLFGTGRTAIKAGFARYVGGETVGLTRANNTANLISRNATAAWTDLNGDRTILNPDGTVQRDEINPGTPNQGRFTSLTFGTPVITTSYDPDVLSGWYKRGYSWETNLQIDHQLLPRLSATLTYYHRKSGNQTATDNRNIDPSAENWTGPFCLLTPADDRLPGGGRQPFCDLYDITTLGNQRQFATVHADGNPVNLVTFRKNLGTGKGIIQVSDGFDLNLMGRIRGGFLQGGIDIRNALTDSCDVIDNPQVLFCRNGSGWNPAPRISGSYTLPEFAFLGYAKQIFKDVQISGNYTGNRGGSRGANWTSCAAITATCLFNDFANSAAAGLPALGRPLFATTQTKAIQLIRPSSEFLPYQHRIDMRFSKIFRVNRYRITIGLDGYNLLNAGTLTGENGTYGLTDPGDGRIELNRTWRRPTSIVGARQFRINSTFSF